MADRGSQILMERMVSRDADGRVFERALRDSLYRLAAFVFSS
jgi:hypothetical protein